MAVISAHDDDIYIHHLQYELLIQIWSYKIYKNGALTTFLNYIVHQMCDDQFSLFYCEKYCYKIFESEITKCLGRLF